MDQHRIDQAVLNLHFKSRQTNLPKDFLQDFLNQSTLSRYLDQAILPAIEKAILAQSDEDTLSIERIDLNLDGLTLANIRQQLPIKLESALAKALKQLRQQQATQTAKKTINPDITKPSPGAQPADHRQHNDPKAVKQQSKSDQRDAQANQTRLRKETLGIFKASLLGSSAGPLAPHWPNLVRTQAQEIKSMLLALGQQQSVRRHLAWHFPSDYLDDLFRLLAPGDAQFIHQLIHKETIIPARRPNSDSTKSRKTGNKVASKIGLRQNPNQVKQELYEFTLAYLIVDSASEFNRRSYLDYLLGNMAQRVNQDKNTLVMDMLSMLDEDPFSCQIRELLERSQVNRRAGRSTQAELKPQKPAARIQPLDQTLRRPLGQSEIKQPAQTEISQSNYLAYQRLKQRLLRGDSFGLNWVQGVFARKSDLVLRLFREAQLDAALQKALLNSPSLPMARYWFELLLQAQQPDPESRKLLTQAVDQQARLLSQPISLYHNGMAALLSNRLLDFTELAQTTVPSLKPGPPPSNHIEANETQKPRLDGERFNRLKALCAQLSGHRQLINELDEKQLANFLQRLQPQRFHRYYALAEALYTASLSPIINLNLDQLRRVHWLSLMQSLFAVKNVDKHRLDFKTLDTRPVDSDLLVANWLEQLASGGQTLAPTSLAQLLAQQLLSDEQLDRSSKTELLQGLERCCQSVVSSHASETHDTTDNNQPKLAETPNIETRAPAKDLSWATILEQLHQGQWPWLLQHWRSITKRHGEALKQHVLLAGRALRTRQLWAQKCPTALYAKLFALLEPQQAIWLSRCISATYLPQNFHQALTALTAQGSHQDSVVRLSKSQVKPSQNRLQESLFELSLQYLLVERGSEFNRQAYLSHLLTKIAARHNLSALSLATELHAQLGDQDSLPGLKQLLGRMLTSQAPISANNNPLEDSAPSPQNTSVEAYQLYQPFEDWLHNSVSARFPGIEKISQLSQQFPELMQRLLLELQATGQYERLIKPMPMASLKALCQALIGWQQRHNQNSAAQLNRAIDYQAGFSQQPLVYYQYLVNKLLHNQLLNLQEALAASNTDDALAHGATRPLREEPQAPVQREPQCQPQPPRLSQQPPISRERTQHANNQRQDTTSKETQPKRNPVSQTWSLTELSAFLRQSSHPSINWEKLKAYEQSLGHYIRQFPRSFEHLLIDSLHSPKIVNRLLKITREDLLFGLLAKLNSSGFSRAQPIGEWLLNAFSSLSQVAGPLAPLRRAYWLAQIQYFVIEARSFSFTGFAQHLLLSLSQASGQKLEIEQRQLLGQQLVMHLGPQQKPWIDSALNLLNHALVPSKAQWQAIKHWWRAHQPAKPSTTLGNKPAVTEQSVSAKNNLQAASLAASPTTSTANSTTTSPINTEQQTRSQQPANQQETLKPWIDSQSSEDLSEPSQSNKADEEVTRGELFFINNAGLVLVAPYMPRLFSLLNLTENDQFKTPEAAERAVHLLQYLVDERGASNPQDLLLNKLFCGVPIHQPVIEQIELSEQERSTMEGLLASLIQHWTALGKTSINGLRQSFLQRLGEILSQDDHWRLSVEPQAYDMLLDRLPWGFRSIRHPWMPRMLYVHWRNRDT